MTVMSAMGCGHQEGFDHPELDKLGLEVNLLPKLYVMTVVWDEDLEEILREIVDTLSTGNVGDGKVFISDIEDVMRIRTGERGKQVL
jgi:nitrogen regulatory protein P-II 1